MTFQRVILPECPQCKQSGLCVIESRKTPVSTRRRKQCEHCGFRLTTHEVDVDFFEEAKRNATLVVKLHKLLNHEVIPHVNQPTEQEEARCEDCHYNTGSRCTFDFPEYNTEESSDCNHFTNGN